MGQRGPEFAKVYTGKALIADPIYQYAWFTVPGPEYPGEKTEKDLLDTPWLQRLRRIHQLQSARWVYPAAEHSRFQHSLGTMHMAGEFGRHLYPSLKSVCPDVPSVNFVEELARLAGLLHDVGHGPFGHFFDDHFLDQYGITHEDLGQKIITKKLARTIAAIKRSPTGPFEKGETIDPAYIAYLIKMPAGRDGKRPRWLELLRQLFSGIYTADNLDYVQRDAFMTGFSLDMVDISRLRFYTFFTEHGITLHQAGISALSRFLNARLNLYRNVYYHRTTRALDLHLQEIFRDTMEPAAARRPLEVSRRLPRVRRVDPLPGRPALAPGCGPAEKKAGAGMGKTPQPRGQVEDVLRYGALHRRAAQGHPLLGGRRTTRTRSAGTSPRGYAESRSASIWPPRTRGR